MVHKQYLTREVLRTKIISMNPEITLKLVVVIHNNIVSNH